MSVPASEIQVLILAAGRGSRLGHLTESRPKAMLALNGIPLIESLIRTLGALDLDDIHVVVGYRAEKIIDHLGNGETHGIRIHYLRQTDLGHAEAAIAQGLECITAHQVLCLCADDMLSANHISSLLTPSGVSGVFLTKKIEKSPLSRVHVSPVGCIDRITSDREDPIITYNFRMETDVLRKWVDRCISPHVRPLVTDMQELLPGHLFAAVDASEMLGINTPEEWEVATLQANRTR